MFINFDKEDVIQKTKRITPIVIGAGLIVVIGLSGVSIFRHIQSKQIQNSPIVKLKVTNTNVYKVTDTLNEKDFKVIAVHENEKETDISSSDIILSRKDLEPIGAKTDVVVSLKDDKSKTAQISVSVERNKIVSFECGYPNFSDMVATLYSNGELEFDGKGELYLFDDYSFPWLNYDEMDEYPITAISFSDSISPTNFNYCFNDIETLEYIDSIPKSVQSMVDTFSGCTNLMKTADWTNCENLLNISGCYSNCVSLISACAFPSQVRKATNTFSGCSSLKESADVENAKNLEDSSGMYQNCTSLSVAKVSPKVKIIDNMFSNCINLKEMPIIPNGVQSMNSTFSGDLSLERASRIPKTVTAFDNCFESCEKLSGDMTIDCNADSSSVFNGAVIVTKLNLKGKSKILDVYANSGTSGNITVNKKKPNENLKSYSDYERQIEESKAAKESAIAESKAIVESKKAEKRAIEESKIQASKEKEESLKAKKEESKAINKETKQN